MVDNSGEIDNYPTGNDLIVISQYARNVMGYRFPTVPSSSATFEADGLSKKVQDSY